MNLDVSEPDQNSALSPAAVERMSRAWDGALADRDITRLLDLYAPDAVLESPLVAALLGHKEGICRGRVEMRPFYEKVAAEVAGASDEARPVHGDHPVIDGNKAIWENPRIRADGAQSSTSSFAEVWVVERGLISQHHAYWGWDRMARRKKPSRLRSATVSTSDADAVRVYTLWDQYVRERDLEAVLGLYADDATIQSPLVQVYFGPHKEILRGKDEVRLLLAEALNRRPEGEVHFYRTDFQWNGKTLFWEYPAETPYGHYQVDLAEVMDLEAGLIKRHRIYWGWYGFAMLQRSAERNTAGHDPKT